MEPLGRWAVEDAELRGSRARGLLERRLTMSWSWDGLEGWSRMGWGNGGRALFIGTGREGAHARPA
jgi:hypothetical protein